MLKIRYLCLMLGLLASTAAPAATQLSVGIAMPHANIGINVSSYPNLVVVPGYPVYYAPQLQANLFFYDGLYWIYDNDDWYASAWYNGPWDYVSSDVVPLYILRVPVRYYRMPPVYFRGWHQDAPPQWGRHWGHDWEQRRSGWDKWDRRGNPQRAPRPVYQQQYSGDLYPRQVEQQQELRQQNYRYQTRDAEVRQRDESRARVNAPDSRNQRQAPDIRAEQGTARDNGGRQWDMPRDTQQPAGATDSRRPEQRQQRAADRVERQPRTSEPRQQSGAEARQSRQQGGDGGRDSRRDQDAVRGRGRNE